MLCDLFLWWVLDVCLVFFYYKKDSVYIGYVELGLMSDIMGYICWFLFFYWNLKNYKIKKKYDVLYENFIMYEKN